MTARRDLVLVGAGHAHVQVLRRWAMVPEPDVRLTLVVDQPAAVYSGMVPGFVAGDYPVDALEIDAVPLARRAGAAVVLGAASAIDRGAHRIEVVGRPAISYDVASLDVGATVRGLDLPGVRAVALATRPIRDFVDHLDAAIDTLAAAGTATPRVVVVGGGAAGVELGFTLQARCRARGFAVRTTVLTNGPELLPGYGRGAIARVRQAARARGIDCLTDQHVIAVETGAVICSEGPVPADLVVWATGAAPLEFLGRSDLPLDADGFIRTRLTLQVEGDDDLFAAGDCAGFADAPWVRKAGVYAVRAGPRLDANLRRRLRGKSLRAYRPQRQALALLHLGDGVALAHKWGISVSGRWVWRWKDAIDRRFMRRFQVLDAAGDLQAGFAQGSMPDPTAMACGGCAAKVAPDALAVALARLPPAAPDPSVEVGLAAADDVATLRFASGERLMVTVDGFRAFADDPWLAGHVAAINAVSDIFAKGGRPRHALAVVTVPEQEPRHAEETLYQVLAGVRAGLDPLGVTLVGGHSTLGPELWVGLSITGEVRGEPFRLQGVQVDDVLVLTKGLGTGVQLAADRIGRTRGPWLEATVASMLRPNAAAANVARAYDTHACTDVSGFGFLGHLRNLLADGHRAADVYLDAVPALPGAMALLTAGLRSTFHDQNASLLAGVDRTAAGVDADRVALLCDPQTSGGLLLSVAPGRAAEFVAALHAAGDPGAAIVGRVYARRSGEAWVRLLGSGPTGVD